jgi:hypothetical protein
MGNRLILAPEEGLVDPAFDKFLDSSPTRRELQKAFNKIGKNDADLMLMVDNISLVVNMLCEKFNVTKGEIDVWVEKKSAELNVLRPATEHLTEPAPEASDAQRHDKMAS